MLVARINPDEKCSTDSATKIDSDPHDPSNMVLLYHSKSGKAECLDMGELKQMIRSARPVYKWVDDPETLGDPDTDYPVYKLPYTGVWVDKSLLKIRQGEYNVVALKKMPIGSEFDVSSMHGTEVMMHTLKPRKSVKRTTKAELESMIKAKILDMDAQEFAIAAKKASKKATHFVELAADNENTPALLALLRNGFKPTQNALDYAVELANADEKVSTELFQAFGNSVNLPLIETMVDESKEFQINNTWLNIFEQASGKPSKKLVEKLASSSGSMPVFKRWHEAGIGFSNKALIKAIENDNNELTDYLMEIGVDQAFWTAMDRAGLSKWSKVGQKYYTRKE